MTTTEEPTALLGLAALPCDQVHPSPNNPRSRLTDIDELASTIRENGLIQPIVVQKIPGKPGFQIIAGHRRYAAVRRLGWAKIAAIVRRDMLPDEELVTMLVENGQRAGLDPIEEARALNKLKNTWGISESELARRVGRTQIHVNRRIMLLSLGVDEQEQVRAGLTTLTAATDKARVDSGRIRAGAVGKKSGQHLSIHHDLGKNARARCQRLGHKSKGAASVGGIACGECWETVIRSDERTQLNDQSEQRGRCVLCDTVHDPDGQVAP